MGEEGTVEEMGVIVMGRANMKKGVKRSTCVSVGEDGGREGENH